MFEIVHHHQVVVMNNLSIVPISELKRLTVNILAQRILNHRPHSVEQVEFKFKHRIILANSWGLVHAYVCVSIFLLVNRMKTLVLSCMDMQDLVTATEKRAYAS